MAKTPAQRGPFGRWLTRVRQERYATQKDAIRDMARLAGLAISESEYAQWEAGSRTPRPDNPKVLRLYEFYGSRPEDPPPEPRILPPEQVANALIEALNRQAAALEALVQRLDRAEESRVESTDVVLRALTVLVGDRAPQERHGGSGHVVRAGTR